MLRGNAVVGQSGGPTAAINATLSGVIRGALLASEIKTVYGMRNGIEGFLKEDLVDLGQTFNDDERLVALEHTPAAALGSCRKKLPDPTDIAFYESLFALFRKYEIRYFFYIGGNDSMDTVAKLTAYAKTQDYEMRFIGVPKTIDNDLAGTDHTPGFGSAAKYIATTMMEIIRDCAVYTTRAVTVVEIMGRDAGWLTMSAALPRLNGVAPDLIYLPERTFDMDRFLDAVEKAFAVHPNVVVAVSEGIQFADGRYVGEGMQSGSVDIFGHRYLSGTARVLESAVKEKFGCKVRSIELNLPQRCASHIASATDLSESVEVGKSAVRVAVSGVSGHVMTINRVSDHPYKIEIGHTDVSEVANMIRYVPDSFINADGNHITDDGVRYALPLILGEVELTYINGMPEHFIL